MSRAYYNEIEPYAAQWLRNLIAAGHIAPGDVDERSIEDVRPNDLRGYTQCHFFAGIGVWSHALRSAGWGDDRPVWTGSCPCQPFSAAGQGAGFDDQRHLWPHFHHLIKECRPAVVFGEQVASKDADPWIDLVCNDVEAMGYAFGAVPFPSAGVGAPHIRDRLYWVADAKGERRAGELLRAGFGVQAHRIAQDSDVGWLGNADRIGAWRNGRSVRGEIAGDHGQQRADDADAPGGIGGVADAELQQRPEWKPGIGHVDDSSGRIKDSAALAGFRCDSGMADTTGGQHVTSGTWADQRAVARSDGAMQAAPGPTGPTNGYWRDADWLFCRDGRWRPVEPGSFPLVDGAPARVGRLRAYGNAINAKAAQAFIECLIGTK